jgi:hypothetical protein
VDYDGDGILDMISGSYDPGDIYLFRGLGKGKYADRELLHDESGVPLVHHPKELAEYHAIQKKTGQRYPQGKDVIRARVASFGSWPAMTDWDDDGDLDMLIGTFGGFLYLRINAGSRTEPSFAAESVQIDADGTPLRVNSHANPVVADWDGDGLWDLVVGAADGSVVWYRNKGEKKAPAFAASQELLPALAENKFLTQYLAPGDAPRRGVRNQICVVDYDRDGKLDLLVGDYSSVLRQKPDLGADEKAKLAEIVAEERELMAKAADAKALAKVRERKGKFYGKSATQSHVWLFLRR